MINKIRKRKYYSFNKLFVKSVFMHNILSNAKFYMIFHNPNL